MRHVITILLSISTCTFALVEEDAMPTMLQECYSAQTAPETTELDAQTNCLEKYLSNLFGKTNILDKKAMNWVESLGKGIHQRIKRQTSLVRRYNTYNPYNRFDRNSNGIIRNTNRINGVDRTINGFDRNTNGFDRNSNGFDRNSNVFDRNINAFDRNSNGFDRNNNGFIRTNNGFIRNNNGFIRNSNGFNRFNSRFPSQRFNGQGLRVRKEIRTMSDRERQEFFDAVNALKNDRSQTPNMYDVFALLHQDTALESGHGGPGFVGWHRYYLVLFEEALRTKNPNVAIPYWDSTLDFNMDDPTQSILFTKIFLGNGQGVVYTGPFANWRTPSNNTLLRRDIPGPRSSLIDPVRIQNVFNKRFHREILSPTAASDEDNLERHHDGVHRWVGGTDGHMGGLTTSPQDPVFFLHHCYIDYLWEKFRERQRSLGIDSESDYPTPNNTLHNPNRIMDNLFPARRNIDGYSDIFTRDIYTYAPEPTCQNQCGGAFVGYLFCNPQTNRCQSRSRQQFLEMKGFDQIDRQYVNDGVGSGASDVQTGQAGGVPSGISNFNAPMDTMRTSGSPVPYIPEDKKFGVYLVDRRTMGRGKRSIRSFRNKNEGFDKENLVTMPITIINEHKLSHVRLSDSHLKMNNIEHVVSNPGTFDIRIQTLGFSYIGNHTNKIYIDDGTEYSESSSFVLFQKPVTRETTAYVRVNDNKGGICKPQCLKSGQSHSQYEDCTGVIKVTQDLPKMYYDVENVNIVNEQLTQNTFLRFICSN